MCWEGASPSEPLPAIPFPAAEERKLRGRKEGAGTFSGCIPVAWLGRKGHLAILPPRWGSPSC